jgi:hypothetical protein
VLYHGGAGSSHSMVMANPRRSWNIAHDVNRYGRQSVSRCRGSLAHATLYAATCRFFNQGKYKAPPPGHA